MMLQSFWFAIFVGIALADPSCDLTNAGPYTYLLNIDGTLPCKIDWYCDKVVPASAPIANVQWIQKDYCNFIPTAGLNIEVKCRCGDEWSGYKNIHNVLEINIQQPPPPPTTTQLTTQTPTDNPNSDSLSSSDYWPRPLVLGITISFGALLIVLIFVICCCCRKNCSCVNECCTCGNGYLSLV